MRTATFRVILILSAVTFIAATTVIAWHLRERTAIFYSNAETIRQPASAEAPRDILWEPAQPVAEPVRTPLDEYEPSVSADGVTLYFVRGRPGENADLYFATRTPDGWGAPQPLDAVNSAADELGPQPSADGRRLYFYSDRGGGEGGYDLWVAERSDGAWQTPTNLGPTVNTKLNEYAPAVSPDGRWLYFSSNRPRGELADDPDAWRVILDEALDPRHYDLYRAAVTADGLADLQPLDALNSPANDGAPALSPGGDFLYFCSNRTGGTGGFDLYRVRRVDGTFGPIEHLGEAVNTAADEMDPAPDLAGFGLNFSTNRETLGIPGARPSFDLYHSTSREVFRDIEYYREQIAWSKILPLLPWILFVPLMLLLLYLMHRFMRGQRWAKLSLIARCLVASLMAHGIIMILLAFWGVSSSVADWVDEGEGTRIALVTNRGSEDLAAQIRGSLTETSVDAPTLDTSRAEAVQEIVDPAALTAVMTVQRAPMDAESMPPTKESLTDAAVAPPEASEGEPEPAPAQLVTVDLPEAAPRSQVAEARAQPDTAVEVPSAAPTDARPTAVPTPAFAEVQPKPSEEWSEAIGAERLVTLRDPAEAVPASAAAPVPATTSVPEATRPQPELPGLAEAERASATEVRASVDVGVEELDRRDAPITYTSRAEMLKTDATPSWRAIEEPIAPMSAPVAVEADAPATSEVAPVPTSVALSAPKLPSVQVAEGTPNAPAPSEPTPNTVVAASGGTAPRADVARPTGSTTVPRAELDPTSRNVTEADTTFVAESIADASPTSVAPPALPDSLPGSFAPGVPVTVRVPSATEHDDATSTDVRVTVAAPTGATARRAIAAMPASIDPTIPRLDITPAPITTVPEMTEFGDPTATGDEAELTYTSTPDAAVALALPSASDLSLPPMPEDAPKPEPLPEPEPEPLIASEIAEVPFAQRDPEVREKILEQMGGSEETERAVVTALDWLVRHQSRDGHWDSRGFDDGCGRCGGAATVDVNIAVTGLSLLCFLGANHTHLKEGPYQDVVRRGLAWLLAQQEHNGALIGGESMYSHGIAAIVLAEAYGMTKDEALRGPMQRSVDLIIAARNRRTGGWRYLPGQVGDTSVLGWQIMALVAARKAGADVPQIGFDEGTRWLKSVASRRYPGRFGYQPRHGETPAMTAESMFVHQLLGTDPDEAQASASAVYLLEHRPDWDRDANTYFWYYGTMALFQFQGSAWTRWNRRISSELLANQIQAGPAAGSWPPADQWSNVGGRIYQTAICTLTLEVYYRYLPGFIAAPEE